MSRIAEITVRRLKVPLTVPYKVSLRTFHHFEPLVAELRDSDGSSAWGEAEIHAGYGHETAETGWAYCRRVAPRLIGRTPEEAVAVLTRTADRDPHATSILLSAAETLAGHPALAIDQPLVVPLLAPVHSMDPAKVGPEIEALLADGFRTLKVKVGFDVDADLRRLAAIQEASAGRATLRLDANQAFTRAQGCAFATALDPAGIELFEQPCDKADWDSNAAVAAVSRVPVMLDESIYGLADIGRAAAVPGVGFVKLKLKKLGGISRLIEGLERIRALGMEPVLGDGTATDIGDWLEACVARHTIRNAGEMNGYLKLATPLFTPRLPFADGAVRLPAGYMPEVDRGAVARFTTATERFTAPEAGRAVQ
jgi:L-alanine-DL-glutamate epimerase-like enolase superfamily enzyme